MPDATPCDACATATRFPLTGQTRTGCPQCWARSVSYMTTERRQDVYR